MTYMEDFKKIIVAVDGFSSCGKSTLAKSLAKRVGYGYVDTGAMYRSVTLYLLRNGVAIDGNQIEPIVKALDKIQISFKNVNGKNCTFLNGENVEEEIREMYVSERVSDVAAISEIRRAMVQQQQRMGLDKGIVMDGRDIGTVVFPNAELKIFMTADPDVRAERRYQEILAKGKLTTMEEVINNLSERDRIDSTRKDSPLRQAEDAVVLDNSEMTEQEQLDFALELFNRKTAQLVS